MPAIPCKPFTPRLFAKDEEYFIAFFSAAVSGTTDPDRQFHATAARIFSEKTSLRRRVDQFADANAPERKALSSLLAELEARAWLGGMIPDVGK